MFEAQGVRSLAEYVRRAAGGHRAADDLGFCCGFVGIQRRQAMKNRNTDLINWNNALSDGVGRSGTRYRLLYDRLAAGNAGGLWLIDVDDVTICSVKSAQAPSLGAKDSRLYGASFRDRARKLAMNTTEQPESSPTKCSRPPQRHSANRRMLMSAIISPGT